MIVSYSQLLLDRVIIAHTNNILSILSITLLQISAVRPHTFTLPILNFFNNSISLVFLRALHIITRSLILMLLCKGPDKPLNAVAICSIVRAAIHCAVYFLLCYGGIS